VNDASRIGASGLAAFRKGAEAAAAAERTIQDEIDKKERPGKQKERGAMQAGARTYPEPPLSAQHLAKPGEEADLEFAPMYDFRTRLP
jgi:hypothetical protein